MYKALMIELLGNLVYSLPLTRILIEIPLSKKSCKLM